MLAYTEPFISLGRIIGLHGYKGEVKITLNGDFIPRQKKMELLFVDFSTTPVPFFIHTSRESSESNWVIGFEGIIDEKLASDFVGREVFLPKSKVKPCVKKDLEEDTLVGFKVSDIKLGELGVVTEVIDGIQEIIAVRSSAGKEILIPAVEEFILKIDFKGKGIYTQIPVGLLGL